MTDETLVTAEQYKAMLINTISGHLAPGTDPAVNYSIAELEELVLGAGLTLPIVRLPEHYDRGAKWFTNRGDVELCNCGAEWPCPLADPNNNVPDAIIPE